MRAGPARCRIGRRQILRHHRRRGAERGIVENGQILAYRTAVGGRRHAIAARTAGLTIGISADQTGVDRKPFATHQPLGHAARDRCLEQAPQQVAVAEPSVPVLREGRMVGHVAVQPQPAEPAIGQIQMHLVAQPPLRPDAHAIADDEHPDHQLRIDRGATRLAVEGLQFLADARQVHEPVDRAQQMVRRHVPLQAEAVEQRLLRYRPLAHHRPVSAYLPKIESNHQRDCKRAFFNTIDGKRTFADWLLHVAIF
jgi:hypothetical protein